MKMSDTWDVVTALCLALSFGVLGLKGDKNQTCSCENDGGCAPNQLCDPHNNCDKEIRRLARIWISVDNNICKKLPSSTDNYDLISTITCDTPVRGQIVTMSKNGSTHDDTHIINFCEIQIWVCKKGLYGRECNRTCHCANNDTCDNHNGTCPNGCPDTYQGATCSGKCGHCLNGDACDDETGHCPSGCGVGYQPPHCKMGCVDRTYGQNCSKACGFCKNNAPCHTKTGECKNGCAAPYDAHLCTSYSLWRSIVGTSVGFVVLGVLIGVGVTVGICRYRRCTPGVGAESSSSTTTGPPATNDAEEANQAKVAKPYNVHVEVPQSERSLYESLQHRANDESLYDSPVFAKGGKKDTPGKDVRSLRWATL
ncbi:scavenger receptor class F member 1-like isoform X2 [Littorina saxatilis]|uniref:scavenger receptor class F member 1-like isoform X2 n=1 Tax=Littorina saxatilis TaxID=31220 RepID=UPI0038B5637C